MRSSTKKGAALGVATVAACAVAIAAVYGRRPGDVPEITATIFVCGVLPGALVGGVVGAEAGKLVRFRLPILGALPALLVIALGFWVAPDLIPIALVPTLAAAFALEQWTRDEARHAERTEPWSATSKGALLGLANAFAVAAVLGFAVTRDPSLGRFLISYGDPEELGFGLTPSRGASAALQLGILVAFLGALPALAAGVALGRVSDAVASWPPLARAAFLCAFSLAAVVTLGGLCRHPAFIAPACLPTLALTLVFERWTRPRAQASVV